MIDRPACSRTVCRLLLLGVMGVWSIGDATRESQGAEPAQGPQVFQAVELNHLSLDVPLQERSAEFYKGVFGFTEISHGRGAGEMFLHIGQGFMNLRQFNEAGMNHFCMSIKDFDGDIVYQLLELAETEPFRMGGRNLHCYDPDRLNVQVQEEQHGWGRIDRTQLTGADQGLFQTVRIHHISLNVTDLKASQTFYQEMFGLPRVSDGKDARRVLLGVGPSAYLELHQADTAGMNHFCLAVENFDPEKLPAELSSWITGEVTRPEPGVIRFHDPQGIVVEVCAVDHKLK